MSFAYLEHQWKLTQDYLKKENNLREIFAFDRSLQKNSLNFSSNDYLNLSMDPRLLNAGYAAAMRSGVGNSASRSVLQCDTQIEILENDFALGVGFKHALFFASGFLANISFFDVIAPSFCENLDQEIFVDHRAHASLFYGVKKHPYFTFKHHDYTQLEHKLARSKAKAKIIVIESLYSMDGDFSCADHLQTLCDKYNALLFVDESHSFGICGPKGSGWLNQYPELKKYVLCIVYGCGKSVGVSGGFFATNSSLLFNRILQKSKVFIYSTGISPFITGCVAQALKIIFSEEGETKRALLEKNIRTLKESAKKLNFFPFYFLECNSPIFAFITRENKTTLQLEKQLRENDIFVKAIRTPSVPRGLARLRITLNCHHNAKNIDTLLNHIEKNAKMDVGELI